MADILPISRRPECEFPGYARLLREERSREEEQVQLGTDTEYKVTRTRFAQLGVLKFEAMP